VTDDGLVVLEVFEDGVPPRFRLREQGGPALSAEAVSIETVRPDGARQTFALRQEMGFLESIEEIPEPHAFAAHVRLGGRDYRVAFEEHAHAEGAARDNNMRAALTHVIADATVSVLVIVGLLLAWSFGWLWMDPLAGIVGALVIASWSLTLIRDAGAVLLDVNPDPPMAAHMREAIETDGDRVADLHLWRLGPGHMGAIVCVATKQTRGPDYYRARLAQFHGLSHLTIEVDAG
jgi:cation diffusion facilitator family transporter